MRMARLKSVQDADNLKNRLNLIVSQLLCRSLASGFDVGWLRREMRVRQYGGKSCYHLVLAHGAAS